MKRFSDLGEFINFWKSQIEIERSAEIHQHLWEIIQLKKNREKRLKAIGQVKGKLLKEIDEVGLIRFGRNKIIQTEIKAGDVVLIVDDNFYEALSKLNNFEQVIKLTNNYPLGNVASVWKYFVEVWVNKPIPYFVFKKEVDLHLYVNDITFRRQLEGLEIFKKRKWKLLYKLKQLFLGQKIDIDIKKWEITTKLNLNDYQTSFVSKAIYSNDFLILHGPFGTGKTTTLVELIFQLVKDSKKVLVTWDSNTAVDNFLYKFLEYDIFNPWDVVRVWPISSIWDNQRVWEYSIFSLIENHHKYPQFKAVEIEIEKIKKQQQIFLKPTPALRRGLSDMQIHRLAAAKKNYRWLKIKQLQSMSNWLLLSKQIERLLKQKEMLREEIIDDVVENAKVVLATNSMVLSDFLKTKWFDVAIIDEWSQASLPSALLPIVAADRFVIAGDHRQLPPTVLSPKADGLKQSLFEYLIESVDNWAFTKEAYEMLRIQYRMNEILMGFPSSKFYAGLLEAAPEVKNIKLTDLVWKKKGNIIHSDDVILRLDVKGNQVLEKQTKSLMNFEEIEVIKNLIDELLEMGIKARDIGIITPYSAQKNKLKVAFENIGELDINTIDGFQGREKEVIIISWVRTQWEWFLIDPRRFNVAITRAKRLLANIGNVNNLLSMEMFKEYINYIKRHWKLAFL